MKLLLSAVLLLVSFSANATSVSGEIPQPVQSLGIVHFKHGSIHSIAGSACISQTEAQAILELTHDHIPNSDDTAAIQRYLQDPRTACKYIVFEKMVIGDTVVRPNPVGIGIISLWPQDAPEKVWYIVGPITTDPE